MKTECSASCLIFAILSVLPLAALGIPAGAEQRVDFAYAPPEWQTAICLPDDPHKTLVDRGGELLYGFGGGGREFATRIGVEVDAAGVWQKQELHAPRVPIVRTHRAAAGLQIVEEAFAVTDPPREGDVRPPLLRRTDGELVNRNWANPGGDVVATLRDIALHNEGALRFELTGKTQRVALALCEGWWSETGKRVQVLKVEGATSQTVDTVKDIGKNKAAAFWFDAQDANGDGKIEIVVDAAPAGADKNTILNDLWVFPADVPADSPALLAGKLDARAVARLDLAAPGGPVRADVILVHVTNTGREARTLAPRLSVDAARGFHVAGQCVMLDGGRTVTASLKLTGPAAGKFVPLEALAIPAGTTAAFCVQYGGSGGGVTEPFTLEAARAARERAVAYWAQAPLPFGRVQVPDAGIQALVDSSIRNIWQAREIKKGLPAFQVGPTCYRGLWIVDGAFLLEAAALVGAGAEARNGVAYELTFQQPDGRIQVMANFSKENGIVLWTCVRHALLTQDKAWLESLWPRLERIAAHIRALRQETLRNESPLDDGLNPPGFPDGGIGGMHAEYTNPYWNLAGLKAFIDAARWLGKDGAADAWQPEYDAFMAAFRTSAARDMKTDPQGRRYLPIRMDGQDLPQRGQWGFCHAVYPGRIFSQDDPLVAGNLAMLAATEREGMVYGTGWNATGIWNYFASFYGHAWLWQGNGRKAADALYAFANHAAPTLVWREEQSLKGEKFHKVGDMPHNWASAEFIRLTVHLLALDRGNELHLLEGLPQAWVAPGAVTRLDGVATPFGKLTLALNVSADGKSAGLRIEPLSDASCEKVVVHLGGWSSADPRALRELDPRQRHEVRVVLRE